MSDAQLKDLFLRALGRMFPRFRETSVSCFKVSRLKYLVPIPTLHYSRKMPPVTTSVPGVYIINSAQIVNGTLNVNETIDLAERAAALLGTLPSQVNHRLPFHEPNEAYSQPVA